jgi:N-acyl-D-amino-acid deacylase
MMPRSFVRCLAAAACAIPATLLAVDAGDSLLISNARVVDGTGAPAFIASVRIAGSRVEAIGQLETRPGERLMDAGGKVLAPGFIDTHSHADKDLAEHPDAVPAVSQGITTIVTGQDGDSPLPLAAFFEQLQQHPAALNLASYVGHNTIRRAVLGEDFRRHATDGEVEAMRALLDRELASGALGLSTGLEYDPGIYSDPSEVLALARLAAERGGRYVSHVRSEDRWLEAAIDEIVEIGRQTGMPVQISHIKLAMKRLWGKAPELLARLDQARAEGIDVTADIYPYEYWHSNMMVLLPERNPEDRAAVEYALAEIAPPEGIWFTVFPAHPQYVGMKLTEVAAERGQDPVTAFMELARQSIAWEQNTGEKGDKIIGTSMLDSDIRRLLLWPHSNLCTDGGLVYLHPRARGSFPRVLGRYVREQGLLSLEEAVHKMTALAARHMGLGDRGRIAPGMAADLVLFDPDTVVDRATPEEPELLSSGILQVWVNGVAVYAAGRATGARPGRVLRRAGYVAQE